ncbi:MAG: hypothetical protein LUM44_11355 [Pyrinomonadaceae bacterium]|nr:hypothetical protein [Pyrinomonadaceae bacterium]
MSEKDYRQFDRDLTIADLYPDLSPENQKKAEYRLLRYLAVVKEVFEEVCESRPEILTELERRAMLRKERNKSRNGGPSLGTTI